MKHSKKIAALIILLLMCAVLINPERYLSSVKDGVILFWAAVLPALFPFFFFTRMLTGLGFPETVGKFFEKPVKFFFHTPPISAYIFFMSVLSGYPIGAKLISEFYKNGVINTEESKKIIAFSSTSAPLFVIGTLGVFMLDNVSYSVIILFSHYLSAIITGLVFCNVRRLKATKNDVKPRVKPLPDNVIGDSINDSVLSVLSVGGLIAIFSLVIDVLYDLKFFDLFGNYSPLAVGFFEMTRGAKEIIKNPPSTGALLSALTGFTSFGGLCIFLQATTFLKDAKVKSSYYFLVKVFQGLVGAGIAYLVSLALP